jgi:choline-glycine betaine transporter
VVVFWGVMMGSIAALMLVVGGGRGDALSGIQNITIIMAVPFVLVMVVMCVALAKDLRDDPLVRRGQRGTAAIEQAIEFGTQTYGDSFYLPVKSRPADAIGDSSEASVARPDEEQRRGDVPPRPNTEATS